MDNVSIYAANLVFGSKRQLYDYLSKDLGYYLPKLKAQSTKVDYLIGVLNNQFFRLREEEVHFGEQLRKASKVHLYFELRRVVGGRANLGFDETCLPNKKWLRHVLFTVDAQNPIYTAMESDILREVPQGKVVYFILFFLMKFSNLPIFIRAPARTKVHSNGHGLAGAKGDLPQEPGRATNNGARTGPSSPTKDPGVATRFVGSVRAARSPNLGN